MQTRSPSGPTAAAPPRQAAAPSRWPALLRLPLQALLLACVYVLLSTPAAYTSNADTLAAIIWPAPAVAIMLLWRLPYRQWPLFLLAVFAAMIVVGDGDALSVGADSAFALLNVFQVALSTWLGRRFVDAAGELDTTLKFARYLVFLPLLATSVVAALGATIGMLTKHSSWIQEWQVMVVGNGLAIIVLLPALLVWCSRDARQAREHSGGKPWVAPATAALALGLLAVSCLVPDFHAEILRALLSLLLVAAALHGGIRAASLGMLAAASAGIALTHAGYGPYTLQSALNGVWELQIDLAGLAMLSFFVAIAVSQREQLHLRLERARRFENMGFLTGGIAHDFNNVLGAVGGYAELAVEREKAGLPVHGALAEVSAAVARGKDLTEQILLAGRRGARTRENADLRDIVSEAVALARPLLPPGIGLVVTVPLAPVPVLAHRGQLVRAMLNLLRNASQAASSQVELRLATGAGQSARETDLLVGDLLEDGAAWVDVLDDGSGIPEIHLPRLFDPFFSSRSSTGNGTGLGLAIVAGVAADHGGGVAVWNGQGQRTLFRLMLPLLAEPPEAEPADDAPALGQGDMALVVAADEAAREHAENLLAALGFEPAAYTAGALPPGELQHARLLLWVGAGGDAALAAGIRGTVPQLAWIESRDDSGAPGIHQAGGFVTLSGPLEAAALRQAVAMAAGRVAPPSADLSPLPLSHPSVQP